MKSVNATCIKKFVYVLCYSRMQIHTIFYPRQPASEVPLPTLIRVYTIPGTKWLLLLDKCGEWFPLPAVFFFLFLFINQIIPKESE